MISRRMESGAAIAEDGESDERENVSTEDRRREGKKERIQSSKHIRTRE